MKDSFLIVGGSRGTGLHIAKEAVKRGARQVIVTGRRDHPEFAEADYSGVDHVFENECITDDVAYGSEGVNDVIEEINFSN